MQIIFNITKVVVSIGETVQSSVQCIQVLVNIEIVGIWINIMVDLQDQIAYGLEVIVY